MVTQKKDKTVKLRKQSRWNWLEDAVAFEKQGFTFPQVRPSLLLLETPASLDRKVPMVPGPKDVVVLSTTKIGTKRFQIPPDAEFDLTEPCRPPSEYNFLHDPHLREYLNNPLVRKTLAEKGLVTKDGYVKCTIKEFNDYRQWIRKLKLNAFDQEVHLENEESKSTNGKDYKNNEESKSTNGKDYKNNEALLLTRKRQERAKELYEKKQKKKELERIRYMEYMEDRDRKVEKMKLENKRYYNNRITVRKKERNLMKMKQAQNENKGKKIRFKILLNSKKNIEHHRENVEKLQQEKITEKEKRAEELWKRRQSYCLDKMNTDRDIEDLKRKQRRDSICVRENTYKKERRKSSALMEQFSKENRENAMRHMEEATEFLERIEAKKEAEIQKWREKLKCIKEREKLLSYYRHKKLQEKRTLKLRRRHSKSRKSVWDVDTVLLKEIMCHMTEDERKELEDFHNELEDCIEQEKNAILEEEEKEEPNEENNDREEVKDSEIFGQHLEDLVLDNEKLNASEDKNKLEIGLTGHHRSFITFGNIHPDDVEEVYHEDEHPFEIDDEHHTLDIPGLVIQHTKSMHEHLPCVDDDHDIQEVDSVHEEVVQIQENNEEQFSITSHSSYEILVIPSRGASTRDCSGDSDVTLVHIIDEVPVLVSSAIILDSPAVPSEQDIVSTAHTMVLASLGCAAKNLGYSNNEILTELGVKLNDDNTVTTYDKEEIKEIQEIEKITNYAKEITQLSLITAAVSLGYDSNQISQALGISTSNQNLLQVSSNYSECIKNMAGEAIFNAAVSLGYSDDEARKAMQNTISTRSISPHSPILEAKQSSITTLAQQLAKNAISNATKKLGFNEHITESFEQLNGSAVFSDNKFSLLSLHSLTSNDYDEPFAVVAHNALRGAALALGYSEVEVAKIIGEEKLCKEDATIQKWAQSLTYNAIKSNGATPESSDENKNFQVKCEKYVNDCATNVHSKKSLVIEQMFDDSFYRNTQGENEYLVRRFSSTHNNHGDKVEETEIENEIDVISHNLVTSAITNAAQHLGYSNDQIQCALSSSVIETQHYEEADYQKVAQSFVSQILQNSIEIVHQQQQEEAKRKEEKDFKRAALKFTMFVLSSACKTLGYTESQIIRAIAEDTSRRTGDKGDEIHPNIAVKFNEASISRARRESLSIPQQGNRRASIKERPSTPKPSKEDLENCNSEIDEEKTEALVTQPGNRQRRPTPFFDESFQEKIIKTHEQTMQNDIIEENEEEEEEEENQISRSVHIITSSHSAHQDFSNFSEAQIMNKIEKENSNDTTILSELSEYPREEEFFNYAQQNNLLPEGPSIPTQQEKSLMNLLGQKEIAPGVIDLYNAIQADIMKLLSCTNSTLLMQSRSGNLAQSPNMLSEIPNFNIGLAVSSIVSPNLPVKIPSQNTITQHSTNNSLTRLSRNSIVPSISVYGAEKNNESPEKYIYSNKSELETRKTSDTMGASSKTLLPQLDSSSKNLLGNKCESKPSLASSKVSISSVTSLPRVASTISSRSRLLQVRSSQTASLPNVTKTPSLIIAQNNLAANSKKEEPEIVIRSPKDFEENKLDKRSIIIEKKERQMSRKSVEYKSTHKSTEIREKRVTSPKSKVLKRRDLSPKASAALSSSNRSTINKSPTNSTFSSSSKVGFVEVPAVLSKKSNFKEESLHLAKSVINSHIDSKVNTSESHVLPHYAQPLKRESSKLIEVVTKKHSLPLTVSSSVFERLSIKKVNSVQLIEENIVSSFDLKKKSSVTNNIYTSNDKLKRSSIKVSTKPLTPLLENTAKSEEQDALENVASNVNNKELNQKQTTKATSSSSVKKIRPKSSTPIKELKSKFESISKPRTSLYEKSSTSFKEKISSTEHIPISKKKSSKTKRKSKKSIAKLKSEESNEKSVEQIGKSVPSVEENTNTNKISVEVIKKVSVKVGSENNENKNNTKLENISPTKTNSNSKPLSRKSLIRPSINRNLERIQSKAANVASVATVSLNFDQLLPGDKKASNQYLTDDEEDEVDDSVKGEPVESKTALNTNIKSSLRFEPSPPKNRSSYVIASRSANSFTEGGQQSIKSILKSRSLGSAGKIMPTDSRQRYHSSSFRESVPMIPLNEQGDCTDFSNFNSLIEIEKRKNSTNVNSSSVMWVPSHSVAKENDDYTEPSPSALLVKSATPSRQVSTSSFKSGHIFVTPAASINFVNSTSENLTRNPSASSRTSTMEIVENQISGTFISRQTSIVNRKDSDENKVIDS